MQMFVKTIMNQALGRICNAHMVFADLDGPMSEDCLKLAKLASHAVDFGKTGVPINESLIPRPDAYPDFMGKVRLMICPVWLDGVEILLQTSGVKRLHKVVKYTIYESEKVLGRMFRDIEQPVFEAIQDPDYIDPRLGELALPLAYSDYSVFAQTLKGQYDFELERLMRRWVS